MKRYFCLFLAAFVLMGACSLCLIRPVSATENDATAAENEGFICELIPEMSVALSLFSEDEEYFECYFDYILPSAFVDLWNSYRFGRPPEYWEWFDGELTLDIVVTVNGISYPAILNLCGIGFSVQYEDCYYYESVNVSSDVPFYFDFYNNDYEISEEDGVSGNGEILFMFPASFFSSTSSWDKVITISAYVGTLPPSDPIDPGAPVPDSGFYGSIESLIRNAFYGEGEITGWQELVVTVLATAALVFMFAIPFLVVIFLIRLVVPS